MARRGFKVFDSDMHIMEPVDLWQRYLPDEFKAIAPIGLTSEDVRNLRTFFPTDPPAQPRRPGADPRIAGSPMIGHYFERNQEIYRNHSERGWTPDCQLEAMDVEGIDAAVLFPTRGLSMLTRSELDPRFAAAIARAYNDWLHDFCAADPHRLLGAGMISLLNIDDAISEARRVVREFGFRSVFMRSSFPMVNDRNWYDPYYEPLWDALDELEVPVGFHESTGSRSRQIGDNFSDNFGIRRIFSQPMEQMVGLGTFLSGGVLARHPRLKMAFLEANCSWVPWLLWRIDEAWEREGDACMKDLVEAPSAYFKRQCWVAIEPDEV